jgi:hypothetical protein
MSRTRTLSILLSALLLLSQLLLALHHADIDAHAGNQHCDVCLIAHGLDHQAVAIDASFPLPPAQQLVSNTPSSPLVFLTAVVYRSRAPPHSLA